MGNSNRPNATSILSFWYVPKIKKLILKVIPKNLCAEHRLFVDFYFKREV